MSIFIDGYNLIGRGRILGLSLEMEDKEKRFLDLLARYRDRQDVREPMLVMFDGQHAFLSRGRSRFSHRGIAVEYAIGLTADDALIRKIRASDHPREITVVSSDRNVMREAALFGARVLSCEDFIAKVSGRLTETEAEKPQAPSGGEVEEWLRIFSTDKEKPEES